MIGRLEILVAGLLVGLVIGVGVCALLLDTSSRECVIAPAILDGRVQFGEIVVCGEMITSKIYGPAIETWTGEIQFYHNHEEDR